MTDGPGRVPIRIPQASVAVTEGTILEWFSADGERVAAGAPLYRMETEKIEMDVEAPATGVLRILAPPGATLPVGEDIGYVEAE